MSEPTCEQRIADYYKGRMETIGALVKAASEDELTGSDLNELADLGITPDNTTGEMREQAQDQIYEYPLSVEVIRVVKITLGTGGPGDWFEATVDEGGSIERIEYHFNDWFDHAQINVSDDDNARAFCEQFIESALMATA